MFRREDIRRLPAVLAALIVAVAVLPVAPAYAAAANNVGTIQVHVAGPTGSVLTDIAVELVNVETADVVQVVKTSEEGIAAFAALQLGLYQVRAIAPEGMLDAASPLTYLSATAPGGMIYLALQEQEEEEEDDAAAVAAAGAAAAAAAAGGGGMSAVLIGAIVVAAGLGVAAVAGAFSDDSP